VPVSLFNFILIHYFNREKELYQILNIMFFITKNMI